MARYPQQDWGDNDARNEIWPAVFLLSPLALAGNQWNVTLPGGNMRFQGVIIAESCRVEAGDQQLTVNMGQISSNRFHSPGKILTLFLSIFISRIAAPPSVNGLVSPFMASPMAKIRTCSRLAKAPASQPVSASRCSTKKIA
jgi:hypothetical protein